MASRDAWVYRQGVLWSANLKDRPTHPLRARISSEFMQLDAATFPALVQTVRQMDPVGPEALASRLEAGRQCYVKRINGAIAAYGWLTRGREWVGEFERELNVLQGEAYIWDCATVPEHRRKRLFSTLISQVADHLSREGMDRLWIIAVTNSRSMTQRVTEMGFSPVLYLSYVRIFDKRFLMTKPAPDVVPDELAAGRRLLTGRNERAYGSLIVGNTARPMPPLTHFDR